MSDQTTWREIVIHQVRTHFTNGLGFGSATFSSIVASTQSDQAKSNILWVLSVIVAIMTIIHLFVQIKNQWKK